MDRNCTQIGPGLPVGQQGYTVWGKLWWNENLAVSAKSPLVK